MSQFCGPRDEIEPLISIGHIDCYFFYYCEGRPVNYYCIEDKNLIARLNQDQCCEKT